MRFNVLCLMLCAVGCAKKEPKPLRTEPWLAHPPASASANTNTNGNESRVMTRFVFGESSVIRFELPTKRGALRGSISRVSGELEIELSDLSHSRGVIRADLGSLTISGGAAERDAALLERARAALELSADARAPATFASFELTSVEDDLSPRDLLEARRSEDGSASASRHARLTAVGNLLLHGFRVSRRAPLEADFDYAAGEERPSSVRIRSRAPLLISLETHAIVAMASESDGKSPTAPPARAREVRVNVELYGTKVN